MEVMTLPQAAIVAIGGRGMFKSLLKREENKSLIMGIRGVEFKGG